MPIGTKPVSVSKTKQFSLLLFLLVSAITLVFGLKPQGNFKANWVTPAPDKGFVNIGEYGYLQGNFPEFSTPIPDNSSLDLSLTLTAKTQLDPNFRIILFIGDNCKSNPMIIGQWRSQLIVMQGCDFPNKSQQPRLSTTLDGHTNVPIDITVSLSNASSQLTLNDTVVSSKQVMVVDPTLTKGLVLLVGNSVDGRHGWKGTISNLLIQRSQQGELSNTDVEVLQEYNFSQAPQSNIFADNASENNQLVIPKLGKFPDTVVLEYFPIRRLLVNEKPDLLLNFFGFTPFGLVIAMCLYCWFGVRGIKLVLISFFSAVIMSLSIELSQVYIAGRRSALHDLVLNASGSILGAWILAIFAKLRETDKPLPEIESDRDLTP